MKQLFGEEINKTGPVGGMDEEGEMEGAYRPTGHPGVCCIHLMKILSLISCSQKLWYAPGDFQSSRFGSRLLVRTLVWFISASIHRTNISIGHSIPGSRARVHGTLSLLHTRFLYPGTVYIEQFLGLEENFLPHSKKPS